MGLKEAVEGALQETVKYEPPRRYQVILLNDHYSTWEFVILVLKTIFHKNEEEAVKITSYVHNNGMGICGEYVYEVAETKVAQVRACAKEHQYPLKCTMREIL
ncbi:ATP-dependent Clp protease adapter protein ClpS [Campylobacterota bacterium]|nr:ATP-dependent Clp protease adapter protein ClpS [Campylobacterota bacterium]